MVRPKTPSAWSLLAEIWSLLELPRLAVHLPSLMRSDRGSGEPVLVLPGFGAGDPSTIPLRAYLSCLGYDVRGWGLGTNSGNVPFLIPKVTETVAAVAAGAGQRVRLVGWSLGGYLAREAARESPQSIECVVTLGTPVIGGPRYTTAGRYYAQRGYDLDAIEAAVEERNRVPLCVPVTAIYTRSDGVVAWEACIDHQSPTVEHVEVSTTHIGLGLSPEVYRIVAERLARSPRKRGGASGSFPASSRAQDLRLQAEPCRQKEQSNTGQQPGE